MRLYRFEHSIKQISLKDTHMPSYRPSGMTLSSGLRLDGKWTVERGKCPVNNFKRGYDRILARAGVEGQFHDLRRTCLTRWLMNGLTEYDVMNLAGQADFETTRRFYLSVRRDLLERTRTVNAKMMPAEFVANLLQTPFRS